jgi:hypothetical protein
MNLCQMDSSIIQTQRYFNSECFQCCLHRFGRSTTLKTTKTTNQTHLLSPRSKNVKFDPPKGYLPLIFFSTKLYIHHIGVQMSGSRYLHWSYDPFEKMVIFPPDPLLRTTFCQLLCFYSNQQFLANTKDYRIATGSQRFVQNTFTARTETLDEDDDNVQTVMTQMAALTTQSQQTAHTAAKTSASVAAAINQLAANQQTIQKQFAAFTTQCNTTCQRAQAVQPPITKFLIPNFVSFPTEGHGSSGHGGSGRGGHANLGRTRGHNVPTLFADFVGCGGQGVLPPISGGGG